MGKSPYFTLAQNVRFLAAQVIELPVGL